MGLDLVFVFYFDNIIFRWKFLFYKLYNLCNFDSFLLGSFWMVYLDRVFRKKSEEEKIDKFFYIISYCLSRNFIFRNCIFWF